MSDGSDLVVIKGEIYVGNANGNGNGKTQGAKVKEGDLRLLRDMPFASVCGISFGVNGAKSVTKEGVLLAAKRVRAKGHKVTFKALANEGVERRWVESHFKGVCSENLSQLL